MIVPKEWKPQADMKRIHVHWTGAAYKANATDKASYHILIEGDGKLVRGDKSIRANQRNSGLRQASHTLRANTGAIGVSMCCMHGANENPLDFGDQPMTRTQWDVMIGVVAELAAHYGIPVSPTTILTHSEVQPNLGITQRGKWDINELAFDRTVRGHAAVGNMMRGQISAVLGGAGLPVHEPADDDEVEMLLFGVRSETLTEAGVWLLAGDGKAHHVSRPSDLALLEAGGVKNIGDVSRDLLLRFERIHPELSNLP